ncbi:filamin-A-like isoform X6 [Anopheles albimanus]|uniref:filamin-A-like isoform X6 n=1 Tax=Anopheles albimanus TaxID=7167 RepID=UPI001641ABD8|nr:filamin-A-like isoform X6 [Anopheles albimanus]
MEAANEKGSDGGAAASTTTTTTTGSLGRNQARTGSRVPNDPRTCPPRAQLRYDHATRHSSAEPILTSASSSSSSSASSLPVLSATGGVRHRSAGYSGVGGAEAARLQSSSATTNSLPAQYRPHQRRSTSTSTSTSSSCQKGAPQYYQELQQQQQPRDYDDPDAADEEGEMEAERDLAEDAQWKRIQQNTFTRWANEHLKIINQNIANLESDLSDGLRLIALIEVLSQKRMSKHNKRPTFRSQKLENVSVALKFLEIEGIKIVNIDSSDIVDCKLKLIMGLIWTLILHYSISLPMWEGDENGDNQANGNGASPKQRLMNWIHRLVPDLPINNFTSDWTNGKAVGALVDAVAPGLCPDWPMWDPKDAVQNAAEAMGLADDWLNVRQLIRPEEMVNPNIDEQSMMTYLSQYPNAKLKPGAPLRPRTNHSRVRAYGPGIEPTGPTVGAPANFTVETFSAGKGNVEVAVQNPNGNPEKVDCRFNNDKNLTYSVSYIPKLEGPHKVYVKFNGRDIPKSPYEVQVEGQAGDASKVTASGPGLLPDGVIVGKQTYFDIQTKDAGKGTPEVIVLDPANHKTTVAAKLRQIGSDQWRCEYTAKQIGLHSVNVFYCGQQIKGSPYGVRVAPVCDPRKVRASGRGLQPVGVRVNDDDVTFRIFTEGAGEGIPEVKIFGPGGVVPEYSMRKLDATTYEVQYIPLKEGRYKLLILYGSQEIPKSPFEVTVGPQKHTSIVAYGPGLKTGMVGQPACFVVETNGETGNLGFSIAGPSQAEIECHDNGDGSALVKYHPTAPGEYAVHILCDNEDIPRSPHIAQVLPKADDFHPELVKVSGPGVEKNGSVIVNKPTEFTVDATRAGSAPLEVKINDVFSNTIAHRISQNKEDGTKKISYTAPSADPVTVEVNYGGVAVPQSPFRVNVSTPLDASKVQFFGPWLEPGVKPNAATHFNVDARNAGTGQLEVNLVHEETKQKVPVRIIDNEDQTFAVEVIPPLPGTYTTNLVYGGLKVPIAPKVTVPPPVDVSKIKVDGLEPSVVMNAPTDFMVDMSKVGNDVDRAKLSCNIFDPRGNEIPSKLVPSESADDVFRIMYTPFEAGRHTIELLYDNVPVPGSPFVVNVKSGCDPTRCRAYGPGLEGAMTDSKATFTVETRGAGAGGLSLAIEGPSEAKMHCTDNRDGSCEVEYLPTEPGEYDVTIRFADKHIPGSPFKVLVKESTRPEKVKVYGPGIEHNQVYEGVPAEFYIDCGAAGPGNVAVKLNSSDGKPVSVQVQDKGDGVYGVSYVPPKEGTVLTANVSFADTEVSCSPFVMTVAPAPRDTPGPVQAKVYGDAATKKNLPASLPAKFQIEAPKANAKEDINVSIKGPDGKSLVPKMDQEPDGTYAVSFVPDECGPYNVSIKCGGKDVLGSPFLLQAIPTGEADKCKMVQAVPTSQEYGKKNHFAVDAREAGTGAVTCKIVSHSEASDVDIDIIEKDGFFDIFYLLKDPGDYDLDIKFGGQNIPNGTFTIKAVENVEEQVTKSATTSKTSSSAVSENHTYQHQESFIEQVSSVSKSKQYIQQTASEEFLIRERVVNGKHDSIVQQHEQQSSSATNGTTEHDSQYLNGTNNSSSNTTTTTSSSSTSQSAANHLRELKLERLHLPQTGGVVTAEVKMPSGQVDKPVIDDNHDGTVSIRYDPKEEGIHELAVKYNGEHVQGSPFKFHVDSISSGYVTAYGPGLVHGVTGEPAQFIISTKGAGAGGLQMAVEGPSKADITYHDNKDGTVSVSYLPTAPGEYKISVRFGDKHIKGSPYFAKITGEGRKRNQISVGSCSEVTLPGVISDQDLRSLNASIQAPTGLEEPCFLKRMPTGNIGISFTPREIGEHTVSVKRLGKHIANSPFKVNVCEREVGDAKKVLVTGAALKEGKTHQDNVFAVDTRNAGYGGLSLSIEGPSKAEIQCTDKDDGTLNIAYKPTEPGYYIVNLKFADHHVTGSPFTVKVSGEGTNRQREKIQRQREAVPITEVGSQCKLTFKMPGITSFDLSATVTSPGGVSEDAEIQEIEDGLYAVHFVPKELGVHTVSVKYKQIHIPGSPFQFTVGPLKDTGSHLVKAGGPGLEHGEQGVPAEFNVWTREAGGGTLAISVEGPSKAEIEFKDRKDGSCDVSYVVSEPGDYRIGLKFNDRHIPDSPFKVYISPAMGEAHKLEVAQFPTGCVQADKPAQFMVRKNGAKGELDAKVVAPSNNEDDCFIQLIDQDQYSVRFYPRENGIHAIHVKFNGVHIPGSPYRIKVGKDDVDPAAVHASGKGLGDVKTGEKTDLIIDTCNAGAGTLAVTIDGPAKVAMDCTEVEEGYKVRYTPLLPGHYYMTIKYNQMHIVGSPFKINCTGESLAEAGAQETSSVIVETVAKVSKGGNRAGVILPIFKSDASKIQSKGMGLKKAYMGKQNQFTVNAGDAGNNILFVGIYGPKGPCDEVFIKHTGRNQYTVNYLVRERGDYILLVKWGDDHIPGSPFKVEV